MRPQEARSLGKSSRRVAIAADDILRLRHFFLESRIVGSQLIAAIRSFDKEQAFAISRLQSVYGFFGQHYAKRIADSAELELDHRRPFVDVYCYKNGSHFFGERKRELSKDLDGDS